MKKLVIALIPCLFLAAGSRGGDDKKKKPDDPTPRKEAIVKLFAQEFVAITPGQGKFPESFLMGSDAGRDNERPVHRVTFKYSFAMARYEVTQELYHVIMGK